MRSAASSTPLCNSQPERRSASRCIARPSALELRIAYCATMLSVNECISLKPHSGCSATSPS
eukprot:3336790-Prymnesium_polylepis.1